MHSFRLTFPTAAVLIAVAAGHRYGFDVMDVTGLPDGTVYPILRRLEDKGALRARWEADEIAHADRRPARRYYALTGDGEEAVIRALERFPMLGRSLGLGPTAGDPATG
jgi:DNA-binding PadR family transcriptional regulator